MKAPAMWLAAALGSLLLCGLPSGWWVIAGVALCVACLAMAAASDDEFSTSIRRGGAGAAPLSAGRAPDLSVIPRATSSARGRDPELSVSRPDDPEHGSAPDGARRPVGERAR